MLDGTVSIPANPLSPVSFKTGLHGLVLIVLDCPHMHDWIEIWWILMPSEHPELCHISPTITEQCFQCVRVHYTAERGYCH